MPTRTVPCGGWRHAPGGGDGPGLGPSVERLPRTGAEQGRASTSCLRGLGLGHPETRKAPRTASQQHRGEMLSCLPRPALPREASGRVRGPSDPQGLHSAAVKPALTLLTGAGSTLQEARP